MNHFFVQAVRYCEVEVWAASLHRPENRVQKKISEKIQRFEVKLYTLIGEVNTENLNHLPVLTAQQIKTAELINTLKTDKQIWVKQRVDIPNKIMLNKMPVAKRLNKLKPESKLFMNVIKMICYRAETSLTEWKHFFL